MKSQEGSTKIVNFMTQGQGLYSQGEDILVIILKMPYFLKNPVLCCKQVHQKGSTKISGFNDPWRNNSCVIVWAYQSWEKCIIFYKSYSLLLNTDKTNPVFFLAIINTKQSVKFKKFMTSGTGFLVLGHGTLKSYVVLV